MAGVTWFARIELRRRWRAVLGLALLVSLAGGVVLATAAGARRTSDVTDRFLAATSARDAGVQIDAEDPEAILTAIEDLEVVARSGRLAMVPVLPDPQVIETDIDLTLQGSPDGRWSVDVDRPLIVRGRAADPADPREVLLNEVASEQTGLDVGDRFSAATFTPEELTTVFSGGEYTGFNGPEVELEVVGISRQGADLQGADITAGAAITVTPALLDRLDGEAGLLDGLLAVELVPGATISDLRAGVRDVLGDGDVEWEVRSAGGDFATSTRDATDVLARALWAFAGVAAVATAVAVGGTITRQVTQLRPALPVLSALGCARRQRSLAVAAVPAAGVVIGTVGAVAFAAALSSRFPISVARRVEPDPGARFDPLVSGVGLVVLLALGLGWSALAAASAPTPSAPTRSTRWRSGTGLPAVGAIGLSHAFDPGGGQRTVPARAALAAAAAGVLGVVVAATVVHSLDRLIDEPHRYGWTWSAEPDFFTDDPDEVLAALTADDALAAVALRHSARVEVEGLVMQAVAFEGRKGVIDPAIRTGRAPSGRREIAVGQHSADELGVTLGDDVQVRVAEGRETLPFEVVGIAVLPPVDTTDPAAGAVVSTEALEDVRRSEGFGELMVDYVPGADVDAVERSLADELPLGFSVYSRPRVPGAVANLRRAMPIVIALAAFSAVLGLVGLGHALLVGSRRRRRDLSTLRALGMRTGQIRRIVAVQSLASMAFALAVGIPLGVAAGRTVWDLLIGGQGLLDAPTVPVLGLAVLVPAAAALAVALSWWPGRSASRAPAQSLRAE